MKEKIKECASYIIIILIVVLIRTFVVTPIRVNGSSMSTTLENGDFMILKKYDKSFDRGDIVVVKQGKEKLIKRIIGLPEEDIEYKDDVLYINGKEEELSFGYGYTSDFVDYCQEDEYFIMGDNREDSLDSRIFGCVAKKNIMGTTNFIIFPFSKWGKVE